MFISSSQYGYNTDYFKYCEYLSKFYKIYYVCFDSRQPRFENENITVYYTDYKKGFVTKKKLVQFAVQNIKKINPDYIYIKYFPSCSLICRKIKDKKAVIDIRTGSVEKLWLKRKLKNILLRIEANRFNNISVISEGLAEKLMLSKDKTFILPLGADRVADIDNININFHDCMNLLYIGTFYQRKIEDTIQGFKMFYDAFKDKIPCRYTIIGFGDENDEKSIAGMIDELNLQNCVHFLGRKKYDELKEYYQSHNIGISYVPITDYFQHQPPTKTYEYICNGLICIATNTIENAKVINNNNGILIKEGPDEVYRGLKAIYDNLKTFDREMIMKNSEQYSWESIVKNILEPFIQQI